MTDHYFSVKSFLPYLSAVIFLVLSVSTSAADRPAPPPSRFNYDLIIDEKSLPEGVVCETRRPTGTGNSLQNWIKNTGKTPFQVIRRDQLSRIIDGVRLVDGKVYGFFPNGFPTVGKTHLKGWVIYEGVEWHLLALDYPPTAIYNGRKKGLPRTTPLPPNETVSFAWDFGGKEWIIKGQIVYSINDLYDSDAHSK